MRKLFFTLILTLFLLIGSQLAVIHEAAAVTNKSYQADTMQLKKNHVDIIGNQKELLAAVKTLESTVKGLNNALLELKAIASENRAVLKKINLAVAASSNQQAQALKLLSTHVERNAEKNLKVLEMIHQILRKQAGK